MLGKLLHSACGDTFKLFYKELEFLLFKKIPVLKSLGYIFDSSARFYVYWEQTVNLMTLCFQLHHWGHMFITHVWTEKTKYTRHNSVKYGLLLCLFVLSKQKVQTEIAEFEANRKKMATYSSASSSWWGERKVKCLFTWNSHHHTLEQQR